MKKNDWYNYLRMLNAHERNIISQVGEACASVKELFLPEECSGCGLPGCHLCISCWDTLNNPPSEIFPPVDPRCPIFAVGPYSGVWRNIILDIKIRQRYALFPYVGKILNTSVKYLISGGFLDENWVMVPAPTSDASRRKRGCDIVTELIKSSDFPYVQIVKHTAQVIDSEGLTASERKRNLRGGVELIREPPSRILLVDDVITTGSTLSATADVLRSAGCEIVGAIGFCAA